MCVFFPNRQASPDGNISHCKSASTKIKSDILKTLVNTSDVENQNVKKINSAENDKSPTTVCIKDLRAQFEEQSVANTAKQYLSSV